MIKIIYDNRKSISDGIKFVVGDKSYGEIIYKRKTLQYHFASIVELNSNCELIKINSDLDIDKFILRLNKIQNDDQYVHIFSNVIIINEDEFNFLIEKIKFVNQIYKLGIQSCGYVFPDVRRYINFLDDAKHSLQDVFNDNELDSIKPSDCFLDISKTQNFLKFFSSGFEARHFNSMASDNYVITKTSKDLIKMEREYKYYHLLPENMKQWVVGTYDFIKNNDSASYSMERYSVPDVAIQWINHAFSVTDFELFINKIFNFLQIRPEQKISQEKYVQNFYKLYVNKVSERYNNLKLLPIFKKLQVLCTNIFDDVNGLDGLYSKYYSLVDKIDLNKFKHYEVIGHGDLCFSNILYDKNTSLIRLIDPKGALSYDELWMDPLYDLAKLSHSINGYYDFINNDLFTIEIGDTLKLTLKIDAPNMSKYRALFNDMLLKYGYNIYYIRLCELSLFLSMLPLHVDNERKVLALIMNAVRIMEELEYER